MNILVITPIDNIEGVQENLKELGTVFNLQNGTYNQVKSALSENNIDVIFTNPNRQLYKLDSSLLANTNVKYICTASTGTNHIDKEFCNRSNIEIISIAQERETLDTISSTAEHAFTLMMCALRNIKPAIDSIEKESWDCEPFIGRQLNSLVIGIVGLGRLGTMMAKYCTAFGAKVIIYDPYNIDHEYLRVDYLEELFIICDVVSLHVHVNKETQYMINSKILDKADSNITIVNTSRGEIVNEEDLFKFLYENPNSKYATDVLENEFSDDWANSSLLKLKDQVIVTPHIGGMTTDAREIAYNKAVDLLKKKLKE